MPLQFPSSPVLNQLITTGGRSWIYNGSAWAPVTAAGTGGTSANIAVYDESTLVTDSVSGLKFVGAGIAANLVLGNVEVTVTATGPTASIGKSIAMTIVFGG